MTTEYTHSEMAMIRTFEAILKAHMPGKQKLATEIMDYARELQSWSLVGIVTGQDEDFASSKVNTDPDNKPSFIEDEYIYQYENGGYAGDNYAGYTFLRLTPYLFLKFHYEM